MLYLGYDWVVRGYWANFWLDSSTIPSFYSYFFGLVLGRIIIIHIIIIIIIGIIIIRFIVK